MAQKYVSFSKRDQSLPEKCFKRQKSGHNWKKGKGEREKRRRKRERIKERKRKKRVSDI